jgi:hypothetical protein
MSRTHTFGVVGGYSATGSAVETALLQSCDGEILIGEPAPQVKGLRLQINSQQTGSAAESYFADLVFRNIAQ